MARPARIEPGPGQESVWDYPRPPRVERTGRRIRVEHGGRTVADTVRAWRVLETSQPPAYYLPPDDVHVELLRPVAHRTMCEWKGAASYWDLVVDGVDARFVDDEQVQPNEGGFYGGWITSDVVGPFKGGAGTLGW